VSHHRGFLQAGSFDSTFRPLNFQSKFGALKEIQSVAGAILHM
jgi:hypothetical protein